MPTRFSYTDSTTTIRCSHCDAERVVAGHTSGIGDDLATTGSPVADFIRWLPARGIYHSWCRSCERAARRSTPNRAARRAVMAGTRNTERKFGVELELIFPSGTTRDAIRSRLAAVGITNWNVKGDGSLNGGNGMEVVTPPLRGEAGLELLRTGMKVLREMNAKPNRSCGMHVHHDIADMDVDSLKRFVKSWANNQSTVLDGLVSPSRRDGGSYYCRPLTAGDLRTISQVSNMEGFRRGYHVERYRTINLQAYGRYGTVEVRQHQGTTDFEKVRSYILLGQAMLDSAKAATAPIPARSCVMDFVRALGTMLDETARTFLIGRAVEFGHAQVSPVGV
jgi:hypothetical protein